MKKRTGRLRLHRETLHLLATPGPQLRHAVGGTGSTNYCEEASGCACASEAPECTLPDTAVLGGCSHTDGTVCW